MPGVHQKQDKFSITFLEQKGKRKLQGDVYVHYSDCDYGLVGVHINTHM